MSGEIEEKTLEPGSYFGSEGELVHHLRAHRGQVRRDSILAQEARSPEETK